MDGQGIIRLVGLSTAAIVFVTGVLIVSGVIVPEYVPSNFRIIAGVVLMLYGFYRSAMIWMKYRNGKRYDDEE